MVLGNGPRKGAWLDVSMPYSMIELRAAKGEDQPMSVGLKQDLATAEDHCKAVASATRTLQLEAQGLSALQEALAGDLSENFAAALSILRGCRGRVIVTGMGKSGHVGLKVSATLASRA